MAAVSIEIRRLSPEQWREWRELRLRSLADSPDAFGSTLAREQNFTEADWRMRMHSMPTMAHVDGTPAALGGAYCPDDAVAHIVAMWTAPEFRRLGLAGLLLADLVGRARAQGRRIVLDVTRGNHAARTTYERAGFVATGRVGPLREGSDLVVEEMELPA